MDHAFQKLDHDNSGSISLDELMVELSRSDGKSAGSIMEIMGEVGNGVRAARQQQTCDCLV